MRGSFWGSFRTLVACRGLGHRHERCCMRGRQSSLVDVTLRPCWAKVGVERAQEIRRPLFEQRPMTGRQAASKKGDDFYLLSR